MDAECDVDHKQILSNIMRFPNRPNRRSDRPIRTNLLTISFFSQMDTECGVDCFAGWGFNLSALHVLLMPVILIVQFTARAVLH